MPGFDLHGNDYSVSHVSYPTEQYARCQQACDADRKCQGWTYVAAHLRPDKIAACCLKSFVLPTSVQRVAANMTSGFVSGVRCTDINRAECIDPCPPIYPGGIVSCSPRDTLQIGPKQTNLTLRVFVDHQVREAGT